MPVAAKERQPLSSRRQVRVAAGGAAILGLVLGVFISPWFFVVPGLVGAGLLAAGAIRLG